MVHYTTAWYARLWYTVVRHATLSDSMLSYGTLPSGALAQRLCDALDLPLRLGDALGCLEQLDIEAALGALRAAVRLRPGGGPGRGPLRAGPLAVPQLAVQEVEDVAAPPAGSRPGHPLPLGAGLAAGVVVAATAWAPVCGPGLAELRAVVQRLPLGEDHCHDGLHAALLLLPQAWEVTHSY